MSDAPRLEPGNSAVRKLEAWLEGQLEEARTALEAGKSWDEVLRTQGRIRFIRELLRTVDPNYKTIPRD